MRRNATWAVEPPREGAAALAAALGIPGPVAQILVARGLVAPGAARAFLDPALEDLSDPYSYADMESAARRIAEALRRGHTVAVYGDYDVDGIASSAIVVRALRASGAQPVWRLPTRDEGYGLHVAALERFAEEGARVVVALDCGATAIEEAAGARALGLDLIVVDHHEVPDGLPNALAVVDPRRPDCPSLFKSPAAAGLAWQLVRAVRRLLDRPEFPDDLLDLAALGTIADMVPLVGDNRVLTLLGLRAMADPRPGLRALAAAAGIAPPLDEEAIGWQIAPRLNAAGRIGDPAPALRLLLADDVADAAPIAAMLDAANRERQALHERILGEALAQIDPAAADSEAAIVLAGEGWHPGVIGIVASRIAEQFYRPTILLAVEEGEARGSGRSIPGFNLVEALGESRDLLARYGGHTMAAGLALSAELIPAFRERFLSSARRRLDPARASPTLRADAEVPLAEVDVDLAHSLHRLAPFGIGNPAPVFVSRGLRAIGARSIGEAGAHLRLAVTDGEVVRDVVGFEFGDRSELLAFTGARVDVAYTPALDTWQDRERVRLVLRDVVTPGVDLDAVLADAAALVERLFARAEEYLGAGAALEQRDSFHTKVAGVTYEGRQDVIREVAPGEPLQLVRDPRNPYDPHAIKVVTTAGRQAGFLPARVAARIAPSMDSGARYEAVASGVTGGGEGRSVGLNLLVRRAGGDRRTERDAVRLALAELPPAERVARVRISLDALHLRRPHHAEIADALTSDEPAAAVVGAGRGALAAALLGAMAVACVRPVVIASPLASRADEIFDRLTPAALRVGLRTVRVHGAAHDVETALGAIRRGEVDLAVVTTTWLQRSGLAGAGLRPSRVLFEFPALTPEAVAEAHAALAVSGGTPFVLAADATGQGLQAAGEVLGIARVVRDPYVRTRLRLVDRRGEPDPVAYLASHLSGREKAVVWTGDPREAVRLAAALRDRLPSMRDAIAYVHPALPRRVRETLEHLLGGGRLAALVSTVPLEAVPDIRHVALCAIPASRTAFLEVAGQAGADGRAATVHLLYNGQDTPAASHRLPEAFPDRETLARVYRAIRARGGVEWPDEAWVDALHRDGPPLGPAAVDAAIAVLVEAGALERQGPRVEVAGAERVELAASLRYAEGERERAARTEIVRWALGAPATEVLRALAGAALEGDGEG